MMRAMPEGALGTGEVGNEILGHHKEHAHDHRDWLLPVIEATLLAIVAVLAAWSGFSSAKWGTDSRLALAQASTARTKAGTAELAAMSQRNFDSSTFTVWFVAYVAGDAQKEAIAERRFTPNFRRAFDAWMATDPATNPHAPQGPTYMPEYRQPEVAHANVLNATADHLYSSGSSDGNHADDYVRLTVYLATVLFLVAISGHFKFRSIRVALIGVSGAVLVFALIQLAALPRPPS
jgi:hypothetical protein